MPCPPIPALDRNHSDRCRFKVGPGAGGKIWYTTIWRFISFPIPSPWIVDFPEPGADMDRHMVYHICPPAPGPILNRYRSEWFRFGADRNDLDPGLWGRYGNMSLSGVDSAWILPELRSFKNPTRIWFSNFESSIRVQFESGRKILPLMVVGTFWNNFYPNNNFHHSFKSNVHGMSYGIH